MILILPFPPKELSPNARLHWAVTARAKKAYRKEAWATAFASKPPGPFEGEWRLDFTFHPPQNRSYDRDNLLARMKSGIDGIADGLGINDKHFTIGHIDLAPPVPGGSVRIHISAVNLEI